MCVQTTLANLNISTISIKHNWCEGESRQSGDADFLPVYMEGVVKIVGISIDQDLPSLLATKTRCDLEHIP